MSNRLLDLVAGTLAALHVVHAGCRRTRSIAMKRSELPHRTLFAAHFCSDRRMSPACVADVITRMRAIGAHLPAGDGAGVFNGVYLRVTEMMLDRLTTGGLFHDDAFVTDLDVRLPATGSTHTTPAATSPRRGRRCSPRGRAPPYCLFNSRLPA
jgi:hypothetical protein